LEVFNIVSDSKWYIVNTVVGSENKAVRFLREEAARRGLESEIEDVVVPVETVKRSQRGKKIDVERKMMPGYVFIKLIPGDAIWNLVKNAQYVTKFLGFANKPGEVPQREIDLVLSKINEAKKEESLVDIFEVGELVEITEGAFVGFSAIIEDVNSERNLLKVLVSIFGRETSLEVGMGQVIKSRKSE
jgi:transcription termination/antitermination protein NusG